MRSQQNSTVEGEMPGIAANKPLLRLTERGWVSVAMVEPAS